MLLRNDSWNLNVTRGWDGMVELSNVSERARDVPLYRGTIRVALGLFQ